MTDDQVIKLAFQCATSDLAKAAADLKSVQSLAENAGSAWAKASPGLANYARQLEGASRGVGSFSYKLTVMGQTLDDLQYVGEQGLRPILNNLMMISPALGIVAVVGENVRKHWSEVSTLAKGTYKYWSEGMGQTTHAANALESGIHGIGAAFAAAGVGAVKFFGEAGEGIDALMGGIQKREQASIKGLEDRHSSDNAERGAAVKKGLGKFEGKDVLRALTEQEDAIGPTPDKGAQQARLAELVKKAEAGDSNAMQGIQRRLAGTRYGDSVNSELHAHETKDELAKYKKDQEEKRQVADDNNERIEKKRKAMAEEVAAAMKKSVGDEILRNESLDDGNEHKKDGNELAATRIRAIRDHLMSTGQAANKEEASEVAKLAYDQIWGNIWKGLRDKVNQGAGNAQQAAAEIVGEEQAKADQAKRDAERSSVKQASSAAKLNTQGALGAAADTFLGDDLTRRMVMARQAAENRTPAQQRAFNRMTLEQRMDRQGRQNDEVDRQAVNFETQRLLVNGFTRDPAKARQIAEAQVAERRKAINGEANDPATAAQEKASKSTDALTDKIDELIRKGVTPRFGA